MTDIEKWKAGDTHRAAADRLREYIDRRERFEFTIRCEAQWQSVPRIRAGIVALASAVSDEISALRIVLAATEEIADAYDEAGANASGTFDRTTDGTPGRTRYVPTDETTDKPEGAVARRDEGRCDRCMKGAVYMDGDESLCADHYKPEGE